MFTINDKKNNLVITFDGRIDLALYLLDEELTCQDYEFIKKNA